MRLLKKYDRVAGTIGRGDEYGMTADDGDETTSGKRFQNICTYVIVFNRYYDARAVKLSMSVSEKKQYCECLYSRQSSVF